MRRSKHCLHLFCHEGGLVGRSLHHSNISAEVAKCVGVGHGVVVRSTPKLWAAQHGGASYLDPGTLDGPSVGVVHMDAAPAESDAVKFEYARFVRRHCLAHESYPGHRLQAVASRAACRLRRFIDDRLLIAGWAGYAVEVLH